MTFRKLSPVCRGLAGFYFFVAIAHAVVLTGRERGFLVPTAAMSALVFAGLARLLSRQRIGEARAHPVGLVVGGVILVNCLSHLLLTGEARQSSNVMLAMVGGGALLLALPWWLTWVTIGFAGWVTCMALVGASAGDWIHFGFGVAFAALLSGLMRRVLRQLTVETEIRFRELSQAIREVFWIAEPRLGRFLYLSPAYETIWGRPPTELTELPESYLRHIHPEDQALVREVIDRQAAGHPTHIEFRTVRPDGSVRWLEDRAYPLADPQGRVRSVYGLTRDITEATAAEAQGRLMEQRLVASQKLESLGLLAGGVAHDFNNILTIILGCSSLARLEIPSGSTVDEYLGQVEQAARRASDLCRQMMAYSGKASLQTRPLSLNELHGEMAEFLRASVARTNPLEFELPTGLPAARMDPTQIQQVVLNLVLNAAEASGAGRNPIRIRTGLQSVSAAFLAKLRVAAELPPGDYVALAVSDQGTGMDLETQTRVFDPFFSTKFTGRGLGLAAVMGIVRGHRGGIAVESQPGVGSTFTVFLPVDAGAPEPLKPLPAPDDGPWRGTGEILVVDDEDAVRHTLAATLEALGFTVSEACDGERALENLRERGAGVYRAVLLDLTMPRMDGRETLAEIRRCWPGIRVIVISGYDATTVDRSLGDLKPASFLPKPCSLGMMRTTLRRVLEASSPSGR